MSLIIREYRGSDKAQLTKLFEDLQDYLVDLDNLKRTRRYQMMGYDEREIDLIKRL